MTSRTTPSTWSFTTPPSTTPCTSPTRWVTPWLIFPRRPCYWPAPARTSLPGEPNSIPFWSLFFFVHFSREMFQPSPRLLSVSFSASTSHHGTPIRSGWWICRTTRTSKRCVWVRAGRRLLQTRWCSDSSPSAECRGKSSACRGPWSAWLDTESSCSSYTTGVRHTHTHFLELS